MGKGEIMSDSLVSALNANSVLLANASSNVANMNTRDYKAIRTTITEGAHGGIDTVTTRSAARGSPDEGGHMTSNVDLPREIADLLRARTGFEAALCAVGAREGMIEDLMNVLAGK